MKPGDSEQGGAATVPAASAHDRTIRVVTAVWLVIVTLGMVAVIVAAMIGLFLGALLSASNDIASAAIPVAVVAAFVASLWMLFAWRKHTAALLVSTLVPAAFAAVVAVNNARHQPITASPEEEEASLVLATRNPTSSIAAYDALMHFYWEHGRHQQAVDALDQEIRLIAATRATPESCAEIQAWEALGRPLWTLGLLILRDTPADPQPILLRGSPLLVIPSAEETRAFLETRGTGGDAAERLLIGFSAAELGHRALALSCLQGISEDELIPGGQKALDAFLARIPAARV